MKQFVISAREAGQRMDKYVGKVLNNASRGFVYKMLRKKNIVLNEKKASGAEILQAQDVVKMYLSDETFAKFSSALPEYGGGNSASRENTNFEKLRGNCPLQIVYEDKDIVVVNKPAGMLSQKAKPGDVSANEHIIGYLLQSGQLTETELRTFRPSVCNRLDRNTSGLLVAGKTMHGLQEMARLLKTRAVKKFYRALVLGEVQKPQRLTGYLTKNHKTNQVEIRMEGDGRGAVSADGRKPTKISQNNRGDYIETSYVPVAHFGNGTLLEIHLITGRSHQIRAHLASVGHPVLGDPKYGDMQRNRRLQKETGIHRQLLHACRMEFPDGRVIAADVPEDFMTAEKWLKSGIGL